MKAARIYINGIVQGVGFRPFVYNLAAKYGVKGWVRNTSAGVDIEAEANQPNLDQFIQDLHSQAPPLSKIDQFTTTQIPTQGFTDFTIVHSESDPNAFVPISPDVTICSDCLEELFDPRDRRYRYPFINCTNCGPRFTIIKDIPYDRPFTTMAGFPLCPDCQAEYENPTDRRFHAQPVACPVCGPHVWLEIGAEGNISAGQDAAIKAARQLIKEGKIVAIRGLGGFHLACNAADLQAVETLRERKLRIGKPFALMFPDLAAIEQHCLLTDVERALITSRERPIVIVQQRTDSLLSKQIAPGQDTLGVMLPYTPLHFLLLEKAPDFPQALVMTSGNLSDEPIATGNQEARERLSRLADAFLLHNREIHTRCDDSVVQAASAGENGTYHLRRSRGYAPNPIRTSWSMPQILAAGAALKNTFCLTKDRYAFLSHHIGDLDNYETLVAYEEGITHFENLFRVTPEVIAYDLHPDYMSTRYATQRAGAEGLPAYGIQHHHAHIAACMAENDIPPGSPVIGLSFDGTGYGTDGTIWGGEVLLSSYTSFERRYHLKPVPLPGGDAAVKQPWRVALSWLLDSEVAVDTPLPPLKQTDPRDLQMVSSQIKAGINAPQTSSMGRLFDAAAAIIGVRQQVSYEAQAAIELEALVDPAVTERYEFGLAEDRINPGLMIRQLAEDVLAGLPASTMSAKFHNTIAEISLQVCLEIRQTEGINQVALSGGVWQNMVLLGKTIDKLRSAGFEVLIHRQVPANDGGLALGQAAITHFTMEP